MSNKIIIGLVGEIASGKDTVVDYLQKKHQATTQKFSASLRDVLQRLYLEIKRENMQKLSQVLRENFDQNLLSRVIAEDIKKDNSSLIIINGVRRFTDIEYLKQLPEFKLIYIVADAKTRYERLIKRSENTDDQNKTFEKFQTDGQAEAEVEITKVGENAEYKIDNNGSMEELYRQVDEIIVKFKS